MCCSNSVCAIVLPLFIVPTLGLRGKIALSPYCDTVLVSAFLVNSLEGLEVIFTRTRFSRTSPHSVGFFIGPGRWQVCRAGFVSAVCPRIWTWQRTLVPKKSSIRVKPIPGKDTENKYELFRKAIHRITLTFSSNSHGVVLFLGHFLKDILFKL